MAKLLQHTFPVAAGANKLLSDVRVSEGVNTTAGTIPEATDWFFTNLGSGSVTVTPYFNDVQTHSGYVVASNTTKVVSLAGANDWKVEETGGVSAVSVTVVGHEISNYSAFQDLITDINSNFTTLSQLSRNVTEFVVIDMDSDDLTMTDEEAQCPLKIVTGATGTNILLSPTTSDGLVPLIQNFVTAFAGGAFYFGSETGGSPTLINATFNDSLSYFTTGSPFSMFNSMISQASADSSWATIIEGASCAAVWAALTGVAVNSGYGGRTDGVAVTAGCIGEILTATAAPAAVSLTTNTSADVTSVSLTAGVWDVTGVINFTPAGTTSITQIGGGVNTTSATLGAQDSYARDVYAAMVPGANVISKAVPTVRINIAETTTVYLVARATFTVSTLTAGGTIRATRVG